MRIVNRPPVQARRAEPKDTSGLRMGFVRHDSAVVTGKGSLRADIRADNAARLERDIEIHELEVDRVSITAFADVFDDSRSLRDHVGLACQSKKLGGLNVNLEGNKIRHSHLDEIEAVVQDHQHTMAHFVLCLSLCVREASATLKPIFAALENTQLRSLSIRLNHSGFIAMPGGPGSRTLRDLGGLLRSQPGLEHLTVEMQGNAFTKDDFVKFSGALSGLRHLKSLSLNFTSSEALYKSKAVLLDMVKNMEMLESLETLRFDVHSYKSRRKGALDDGVLNRLAGTLRALRYLREIELGFAGTCASIEGVEDIFRVVADGLDHVTRLKIRCDRCPGIQADDVGPLVSFYFQQTNVGATVSLGRVAISN